MTSIDRRGVILAGIGAGALAAAAGPRAADAATQGARPLTAVTDLGVKADSGADQTQALQQAIDDAAAKRLPLFFPPGAYRATRLELRPDSHLAGVHGRSVLVHDGTGPFLTASVADNLRLAGLVFNGGGKPGDAPRKGGPAILAAEDCRRLYLGTCEFTASGADGVSLNRCAGRVADCLFSDIAGAGLKSIDAKGLEISHNHLAGCGDNGIQVWRSAPGEDGTLVIHNRVERIRADSGGSGQNGNGINVFRAGDVLVQGNRINDCAFSAIRANTASNIQMIGNSCARLGEVALYAEFAFEGAIIANNMVDRAAAGISITNYKEHGGRLAVAQGNLIRNLAFRPGSADKRGFGIALEADGVVIGNVVEGAAGIGILLGWGAAMRDVTATGNIVRDSKIGIGVSVSANAGYAFITNNMISGAKEGAVRAMDLDTLRGPDLALSSSEVYRNIAVFSNVAI